MEMDNYFYETVSEATSDLVKRGYTSDFTLSTEEDCLISATSGIKLLPKEFEIDEVYRFEGSTDPGDSMIVIAISSSNPHVKGVIVNAYGMYSDTITSKVMERLKNHLRS